MFNHTRSILRAFAVIGVTGAFLAVGGAAQAKPAKDAAASGLSAAAISLIPEAIRPPAGSRPVGAWLVASGTQTYTCVVAAGATTGAFTGGSVPEAQLIGTAGKIHHFGGPSWQSVKDGSLVTAVREAGVPREGTIQELLLKVDKRTGKGILSKSDYINRLYTSGGVAPTGSCTAGQTATVNYGALYVFWDAPNV
ncbi:DUF3455 domain-containing protein [Paractinoplanes rishiriensis]|uniref:DUF3455 domain-containing protein n=1 Tax=Paractinoplanes rishiriensis TaxID=1050105 RepID=A0A919K4Z7_9ACTN|nr:DUF3455 domain-containing protein [Actinoplanes rishiriensis]GIE98937.1 hypothetical protein Ari01nite_64020 [Actinoplanes rishiriensis]